MTCLILTTDSDSEHSLFFRQSMSNSSAKKEIKVPICRELPTGGDGTIVVVTMLDQNDANRQKDVEAIYKALSSRVEPFAVIMDLRQLTAFPSTHRQMYADVRERLRPTYARYHRLTVYLVIHEVQRGFVTAVGWKAQAASSSGRVFVTTFEEAQHKCLEALAKP